MAEELREIVERVAALKSNSVPPVHSSLDQLILDARAALDADSDSSEGPRDKEWVCSACDLRLRQPAGPAPGYKLPAEKVECPDGHGPMELRPVHTDTEKRCTCFDEVAADEAVTRDPNCPEHGSATAPCPTCGAPAGYPPAGPCDNPRHSRSQAGGDP